MNSVNLIGRLTKDPEDYSTKETTIVKFTIAVDRRGSDNADFIRCTAFNKTAEFVQDYFAKGQRVGISGRIQTGSYVNDKDETVYTTDIIVESCDFADGKKASDREEAEDRSDRKKGGRNDRRR